MRFVSLVLLATVTLTSCNRPDYDQQFKSSAVIPPERWENIDDKHSCYLKINREWRSAFRVNCFAIDGDLYTHTNRFVEYNQWWGKLLGRGEAWAYVVVVDPEIQVAINDRVHDMKVELIPEPDRTRILANRNYNPIPEAIRVYKLNPN